jgi:hypothetical protein
MKVLALRLAGPGIFSILHPPLPIALTRTTGHRPAVTLTIQLDTTRVPGCANDVLTVVTDALAQPVAVVDLVACRAIP